MMMRFLLAVFSALFVSACASDEYRPWLAVPGAYDEAAELESFTLERTACFGFCPVYTVTVSERDILLFKGERFVAEAEGAVSKRLPDGAFVNLIEIARAHNFAEFGDRYPNEASDNCEAIATDMPSVIISIETKRLAHAVSVYQGCMGFEGRERFNEMVLAMDAVLDIDDWIGPRESFYRDAEADGS
ncbi:MAG: DUF6438 domain-containing protein [Pseudomonadota bacterium]